MATKTTRKKKNSGSVASLAVRRLGRAQSRALARLTLAVSGRIHEILLPMQEWLTTGITGSARTDGTADPVALMGLSSGIDERWKKAMREYGQLLERAREQAASLPFGVLVRQHNAYFNNLIAKSAEVAEGAEKRHLTPTLSRGEGEMQEALTAEDLIPTLRLWEMRRTAALRAMAVRLGSDGLVLSDRLWRLDNGGLSRIRATLAAAFDGRTNALLLARQIEAEMGANAQMPRWTTTRLYKMTPRQRMADRRGLVTDPAHRSRGVAYNAVRLARTELQYANHAVSTEIAQHNPAVIGRYVRLSPGHPRIDICDELAAGGPYAVTDALLPPHPNCMCYYEDVLMDRKEFGQKVQEWVEGGGDFLDEYASWMGMRDPVQSLPYDLPIAELLEFWLSTSFAAEAVKLLVH